MTIEDDELRELLIKCDKDNINIENAKLIVSRLSQLSCNYYCKNFIVVYGSLRKGQYNYNSIRETFGKENFIFIKDQLIEYAQLYDLGDFPAICHASYRHSVKGELMYCSNEVFQSIKEMETLVGYKEGQVAMYEMTRTGSMACMPITYYEAGPSLMNKIKSSPHLYPLIQEGDWIDYIEGVEANTINTDMYNYD